MQELYARVVELRNAIRQHRDQKGDDRCWLDDYVLHAVIEGSDLSPVQLPNFEEMMGQCTMFHQLRGSDLADTVPVGANFVAATWDDDLSVMNEDELMAEMARLKHAIRTHRDIKDRPRSIEDDRVLYAVMPEKIPGNFQLPPIDEFLGRAKEGAGCPTFWESHEKCVGGCNVHAWGPCGKKFAA